MNEGRRFLLLLLPMERTETLALNNVNLDNTGRDEVDLTSLKDLVTAFVQYFVAV